MYSIFQLPEKFLHKKYTKDQTNLWDSQMRDAATGSSESETVSEELTPGQKKKVDSYWGPDSSSLRAHNEAFGNGVERVYEPYDSSKDITTHNNSIDVSPRRYSATHLILTALHHSGYTTENYKTGLVSHTDTPDKKVKISKALDLAGLKDSPAKWKINKRTPNGSVEETKSGTFQKAYENDPERGASKGEKGIVFTRNKYDVAGMSTDRGWSSCMNMVDGENRKYLEHDINHGTVTAYFVHHDDQGLKSPVGRVNLKKFENGSGHVIYRPEESTYGTIPKNAVKHIHEWSEKNYPSQPGIYVKAAGLYNDDGKSIRVEKSDQMAQGDTVKNHSLMSDSADHIMSHGNDNPPKHWDEDQEHSPRFKALYTVYKIGNEFTPLQRTHQVIHALIDHAAAHDGADRENARFQEEHDGDVNGDDVVHHWAKERLDNTSHRSQLENNIKGAGGMSADDAFKHHAAIHEAIHNTRNPDEHKELKDVHAMLMHKVMYHGTETQKDSLISDVMSRDNSERKDYYKELMNGETTPFDRGHPAEFTTNPRLIHHMIKDSGDAVDHFSGFGRNGHYDHDVLKHIGKHIDLKGAHEIMHDPSMGQEHRDSFVEGLNDNHHGEHIQHSLTDEMFLHGGHSERQVTTLPVDPVKQHTITRTIDPSTKFGEKIHHHISPTLSTPRSEYSERVSDEDHNDKFHAIAENTRYKSVLHKLKNRSDTKDHPALQDAFDNNSLRESVKSLKQFLQRK
jgi:hypothetical protein